MHATYGNQPCLPVNDYVGQSDGGLVGQLVSWSVILKHSIGKTLPLLPNRVNVHTCFCLVTFISKDNAKCVLEVKQGRSP